MDKGSEVVAINDMTFCWRSGGPDILDIPELTVVQGERVFVKGASGSGKSTLLSLLGGVNVPQQGNVRILGRELQTMGSAKRDRFRADHVGFLFQIFNLLPYLTPLENVLLPCRFSRRRRDKASHRSGSPEAEGRRILDHLDMSDERLLTSSSMELSVGQQQRVAAARALIGAPELLIADEPTSALDWDRRRTFLELLEQECRDQGSTLVFVSHDATLEPMFDRTVVLNDINRAVYSTNQEGDV